MNNKLPKSVWIVVFFSVICVFFLVANFQLQVPNSVTNTNAKLSNDLLNPVAADSSLGNNNVAI